MSLTLIFWPLWVIQGKIWWSELKAHRHFRIWPLLSPTPYLSQFGHKSPAWPPNQPTNHPTKDIATCVAIGPVCNTVYCSLDLKRCKPHQNNKRRRYTSLKGRTLRRTICATPTLERDKTCKKKQKTPLFFISCRRAFIDPDHTLRAHRGRPSHFRTLNFSASDPHFFALVAPENFGESCPIAVFCL